MTEIIGAFGIPLCHVTVWRDVQALGESPEDLLTIPVNVSVPTWPAVPSEPGFDYDVEDVVFPNVAAALEVVSGDVALDPATFDKAVGAYQAAVDAVRQSVYTPTLMDGVPVPVLLTVTVRFGLRS